MSTADFSICCQVCSKPITDFCQNIRFIMTETGAVQERETIALSCGCSVDFPDWQINMDTGQCQISNFAGTAYFSFYDEDMLREEDD